MRLSAQQERKQDYLPMACDKTVRSNAFPRRGGTRVQARGYNK